MKLGTLKKVFAGLGLAIALLAGSGCGSSGDQLVVDSNVINLQPNNPLPQGDAPVVTFEVVNRYPHQTDAFTQGLLFSDGRLYESTGLVGESSLREVDLNSGNVLRQVPNLPTVFAEGLAQRGGQLYQLTLNDGLAYVWNRQSFTVEGTLQAPSSAWGLTYMEESDTFVLSDGSSNLRFLDASFRDLGVVPVTDNGASVSALNELEYVGGVLLANRYMTDEIVAIDPSTGVVLFRADLSGLIDKQAHRLGTDDVLNGIAYDAAQDRLFVTGKRWPFLYQIRIVRS